MTLEKAIDSAKRKRDAFSIDTHVLRNNDGTYFSVLDFSLKLMLEYKNQFDKTIYYTAWNLKK